MFFAGVTIALLAGLHWTEFQLISRGGGTLNQGRYLLPLVGSRGSASRRRCGCSRRGCARTASRVVTGGLLALQLLALGLMLDRFYA